MDVASLTPRMALAATECPIERPLPKLVKVVPLGVMASKRARNTESVPGSHPAAVMETVRFFSAIRPMFRTNSEISV